MTWTIARGLQTEPENIDVCIVIFAGVLGIAVTSSGAAGWQAPHGSKKHPSFHELGITGNHEK